MERLEAGDPVRIGAYRLVARLGAGGMGHVYLARSERGRTVAVKLVRRELAEQDEFRDRFRQEVAASRRVGGRWTAPVLDADTEAAVPWVATGYVAGPSLRQVVGHDHGPLPERSVRVLAAGLAHALQDIHTAGIVHRDLKPSNVLVTIDGPRVIDFGIARALETVTDGGLTRAGALVGSPGFMAPEQVRGDRVTAAADVFCLGSVLAYAATGALPFGAVGSGAHAMMFRIAQEEPDLTGVPESMVGLIRDCLHKNPAERPAPEGILARTGVSADAVAGGYERDTWLPGALVAQLGRHAVRLLEVEDPEGAPGNAPPDVVPGYGPPTAPSGHTPPNLPSGQAPLDVTPGHAPPRQAPLDVTPEHESPGLSSGQAPLDVTPGHASPAVTPSPAPPDATPEHAHGHPQHPQPQPFSAVPGATQRPPVWPGDPALDEGDVPAAWSRTPVHTPMPYAVGRAERAMPRRARSRLSVALTGAALVVVLAGGASVVALMNGGGDDNPPDTSPSSATGQSTSPRAGAVPAGYLGTWTASIDNSTGHNTRRLTIAQGEVGDRVLTLLADGPTNMGTGTYHCVFVADLAQQPTVDAPLRIGPSTVASGEPDSYCTPGVATTLTLLLDGRLQRANVGSGEKLTYTKAS